MMTAWKTAFLTISLVCCLITRAAAGGQTSDTMTLAAKVLEQGLTSTNLETYQGSLLLEAMSELALASGDKALLGRVTELYEKFGTKAIRGKGSFISYQAGGSGAAYLVWRGVANTLRDQVADGARRMVAQQKRSSEGLLIPGWAKDGLDQVFIDMAFAVSPYLLYAGLAEKRNDYVDLAAFETLELFRILRDRETGLVHQGRGFQWLNVISEDNWSRGNGWGALALANLVRDLPQSHPKRKELEALAKDFFLAVIRHQDKNGLWRQEMTDPSSYTETSGSGLMLYGLGIVLEKGLLDEKYKTSLIQGLSGLTAYISADGSVSHTCAGCLCPGLGKKEDYKKQPWRHNEPHAFGPLVLAFAQAGKMGISQVKPIHPAAADAGSH